jgi:LmbE family N-acetylglucosaminyl deacetylase
MLQLTTKNVAIIIAHPDDEILWVGGTILSNPLWKCFVVCLCRKSDPDRAPRFYKSLEELKAEGHMGDLDDGPEQNPLDEKAIEHTILELLPSKHFDLIITHSPLGEYTKHIRHEEVSKAVIRLWNAEKISTNELWTFAYEDGNKAYYPRAIEDNTIYHELSQKIWLKKYSIITETYGFKKESWEAQTTPHAEAFVQYTDSSKAKECIRDESALA